MDLLMDFPAPQGARMRLILYNRQISKCNLFLPVISITLILFCLDNFLYYICTVIKIVFCISLDVLFLCELSYGLIKGELS